MSINNLLARNVPLSNITIARVCTCLQMYRRHSSQKIMTESKSALCYEELTFFDVSKRYTFIITVLNRASCLTGK